MKRSCGLAGADGWDPAGVKSGDSYGAVSEEAFSQ
jgi:hypothetical protein